MKVSFVSDKGLVRDKNEDYILLDKSKGIYIIADGMGGHKGGEVASRESCRFIYKKISEENLLDNDFSISDFDINRLITEANSYIYSMSLSDEELAGMGTTIVLLLIKGNEYVIAHVGDSRLYSIVGNHIEQLTKDHSFVQDLVDMGKLTKEEARVHKRSNIITQALGNEAGVEPSIIRGKITSDFLLLCTDGLSDLVRDEKILEIVLSTDNIDEITEKLVSEAKLMGGRDNISVILINEFDRW